MFHCLKAHYTFGFHVCQSFPILNLQEEEPAEVSSDVVPWFMEMTRQVLGADPIPDVSFVALEARLHRFRCPSDVVEVASLACDDVNS